MAAQGPQTPASAAAPAACSAAPHAPSGDSAPRPVAVQHRCHPRMADIAHVFTTMQWGLLPERTSLWWRCFQSAPGAEPDAPFLLSPDSQRLRLKSELSEAEGGPRTGGGAGGPGAAAGGGGKVA